MLKQALEMSMQPDDDEEESETTPAVAPDLNMMSEEDQIAYAMQMSLQAGKGMNSMPVTLRFWYLLSCV